MLGALALFAVQQPPEIPFGKIAAKAEYVDVAHDESVQPAFQQQRLAVLLALALLVGARGEVLVVVLEQLAVEIMTEDDALRLARLAVDVPNLLFAPFANDGVVGCLLYTSRCV